MPETATRTTAPVSTNTAPTPATVALRTRSTAPLLRSASGVPAIRLAPASAGSGVTAGMTPTVAQLIRSPGPGERLPAPVQAALENSLGVDLNSVRVHTDTQAAAVVDEVGARAFTYGLHIFLGLREQPGDLALMAHEVTHVVQQRGRPVLQMAAGLTTNDALEQEAQHVSSAVQSGQSVTVQGRTNGPRVQGSLLGDLVNGVIEWAADRGWAILEEYAPELVPIMRQGPVEWLRERISAAVESVTDTLMRPVRAITGVAASLSSHFGNLINWIREAGARIARGDCGALREAAERIQQVFEGIAAPIIERLRQLVDRAKSFFSDLWKRFGAPVWQFLQELGGAIWARIQQMGRWIWEKTEPIRRRLTRAWNWIKNQLGIGEGPEGQDGILQWFQRKAQWVWDQYIAPFIERFKRPLLVIGAVLVMLSPAGPIIAIGAAIAGVAAGIRWIRQFMSNPNSIVNQRNALERTIIPGILNGVNRVSSFLLEKARFIADKLTAVVSGLSGAVGAVAGTILNFAVGILQWLLERFQELVTWATEQLLGLAELVRSGLERLRLFLQPVLDFLRRVAAVVANVMRLPMELGARIWNLIPACIRDPFINFFIPLILRQIAFFRELAATPEAWQETRAQVMTLIRQIFRNFDLIGAMRTAFRIVVRALRIPVDLMGQLLDKAARAWDAVLAAPMRFIENAFKAILQGMGRFMRNITSHLGFGVQGWLLNAVSQSGVAPPSSWDLRGIFGFVLDVLGISLNHVIDLIDRRVPGAGRPLRTAVHLLSGALEWLQTALREGPRGLWRHLVNTLSNLGTMVLESAVSWIMTRVVANVSARLAALAASAGLSSVLEAVKAVYNAIQTAIEFMPRILAILIRVFDTVIQIAGGVIGPAAGMVESGLRMAMPVAIGFLANYAGLGGLGGRIREIIQDIRERVDNAILRLIDGAIAAIRSVLNAIRRGVQAVREWWQERRPFRSANGVSHTLLYQGEAQNAELTVQSVSAPLSRYLGRLRERGITIPQRITDIQEDIYSLKVRFPRHSSGESQTERLAHATNPQMAEQISQLFRNLAQELERLPDPDNPDQNLVMPPSHIASLGTQSTDGSTAGFSGVSEDGRIVEAKPLSINPGGFSGSAAAYFSPLYRAVNRRTGTYVAGHLLSAHVWGSGREASNLAPITELANSAMSAGPENLVHNLIFTNNKVVHYKITAHYPSNPTPSPIIPAEGFLPTSLSFEVKIMRLKPSVVDAVNRTSVDLNQARRDANNWEDDPTAAVAPPAPISSTSPKTQPLSLETLNTSTRERIIEKTRVTHLFAEAIVRYAGRQGFQHKADFRSKMENAASTGILVLDNRYNPRQNNIDTNVAKITAAINDDLTWKT